MNLVLYSAVALAALIFIAVSATVNALFLSSLGRTTLEVSLLAMVSVAADITKAVLPVVIFRALLLRAWVQAAWAVCMLLAVIVLSLASGIGFAAMTRSAVTAFHDAKAAQLSDLRHELKDLQLQITALGTARPSAVIEAELAAAQMDRRWALAASCKEAVPPSVRSYCAGIARLRQEIAVTRALEELVSRRSRLTDRIDELQAGGVRAQSDPQASAIAELLGINTAFPRVIITSYIAVILELGSVVLVLLAAGPTLRGWREPGDVPLPPVVPAEIPLQPDRAQWERMRHREREKEESEKPARTLGHARK
jgi:hypothetical protein